MQWVYAWLRATTACSWCEVLTLSFVVLVFLPCAVDVVGKYRYEVRDPLVSSSQDMR
jgi:hypothetical protein